MSAPKAKYAGGQALSPQRHYLWPHPDNDMIRSALCGKKIFARDGALAVETDCPDCLELLEVMGMPDFSGRRAA